MWKFDAAEEHEKNVVYDSNFAFHFVLYYQYLQLKFPSGFAYLLELKHLFK